jgi:hypothetical protein
MVPVAPAFKKLLRVIFVMPALLDRSIRMDDFPTVRSIGKPASKMQYLFAQAGIRFPLQVDFWVGRG